MRSISTIMALLQIMRLTAAVQYETFSDVSDDLLIGDDDLDTTAVESARREWYDALTLNDVFDSENWDNIYKRKEIARETRLKDTCFFVTFLKHADKSNFTARMLTPSGGLYVSSDGRTVESKNTKRSYWSKTTLGGYVTDKRANDISFGYSITKNQFCFTGMFRTWWDQNKLGSSILFGQGVNRKEWDIKITLVTKEEARLITHGEKQKDTEKISYAKRKNILKQKRPELFSEPTVRFPNRGMMTRGNVVYTKKDGEWRRCEVQSCKAEKGRCYLKEQPLRSTVHTPVLSNEYHRRIQDLQKSNPDEAPRTVKHSIRDKIDKGKMLQLGDIEGY